MPQQEHARTTRESYRVINPRHDTVGSGHKYRRFPFSIREDCESIDILRESRAAKKRDRNTAYDDSLGMDCIQPTSQVRERLEEVGGQALSHEVRSECESSARARHSLHSRVHCPS